MNNNIEKILNDLYAIEPALKAKESLLRPLIERMIVSRPSIKVDEHFVQELRGKLIERALAMPKPSPFSWLVSRRLAYAAVSTLVLLLVIMPLVRQDPSFPSQIFSSHIETLGDQAFGDIAGMLQSNIETPSGGGMGIATDLNLKSVESSVPQSESGTAGSMYSTEAAPPSAMGIAVAEPSLGSLEARSSIIYPYPAPDMDYQLVFNYEGDPAFEVHDSLPIYKRIISPKGGASFIAALNRLNPGIDLSKFQDVIVGNISLRENRPFGYNIDFNFAENQMYVYKNWEQWPQGDVVRCMAIGCEGESAYQPLTKNDVPSDDELIRMADEFLAAYGIDTSAYGKKFVNDQWLRIMPLAETSGPDSSLYIPEEIVVVYQLLIDEKPVFDEGGMPAGLNVSIDIRNKRVAGVNTINAQNYQKSNYPALATAEEIISEAKKGGRFGYWGFSQSKNQKTVTLGTPELVLMRTWLAITKGQSGEVYVPAYVFPVTKRPEDIQYTAEYVVVPAVKGIFPDTPTVLPVDIGTPELRQTKEKKDK